MENISEEVMLFLLKLLVLILANMHSDTDTFLWIGALISSCLFSSKGNLQSWSLKNGYLAPAGGQNII